MVIRALAAVTAALAISACATDGAGTARGSLAWGDREPVVYAVVVAEVLDDSGLAPPVVYVVDRICKDAGQVEPEELTCGSAIPDGGRSELAQQLERYTQVDFVTDPAQVLDEQGRVGDGGLLFWLGPIRERTNGELRVGANYASALSAEAALGVNLAMRERGGSFIVTGAAGLGGCPA
jgi:hypothetical protein